MTGWGLSLGTMLAATLFGLFWQHRQGRVQPGGGVAPGPGLPDGMLDGTAAVTLLLLTSPVCARCPQARTTLRELATAIPGVRHTEVDLGGHPELATELGVRSTPTTLVISRTGHELFRVIGVPRRTDLLSTLRTHL